MYHACPVTDPLLRGYLLASFSHDRLSQTYRVILASRVENAKILVAPGWPGPVIVVTQQRVLVVTLGSSLKARITDVPDKEQRTWTNHGSRPLPDIMHYQLTSWRFRRSPPTSKH